MKLTSDLFADFLKCPTKCYLRSTGQAGTGNAYADWVPDRNELGWLAPTFGGHALDGVKPQIQGESAVQHSLWADDIEAEAGIWRDFLSLLATVERPVLLHYGSFETRFLTQMGARYPSSSEATALLDNLKKEAVNLLLFIHGQVF
jgi:hypothetical protein